MKKADLFALLGLVLLVSGFLLGAGIYWDFRFSLDSEVDLHVERREPREETPPEPPNIKTPPEPPIVETTPAPPPLPSQDPVPVVDGMWICVESGKRYLMSDTGVEMKMYEDDLSGKKLLVGTGRQDGRKLNFDFHSTIHDVDGSLSLEVEADGRKMLGMFRGMAPKDKGPVTLLRVD